MDYEKMYKDSVLVMKQKLKDGAIKQCHAEEIFPELKESEDERIRKDMIFYFKEEIPQCSIQEHADKMKKFIAWLEKQGEQKPADKVEPKFNVGDWIVYNNNIYYIGRVALQRYYLCYGVHDTDRTFTSDIVDAKAHLWTIQDAKPGDVLVTPNQNVFIFKEIKGTAVYDYCGLYFNIFCKGPSSVNGTFPKSYVPATKEQRNLLFHTMKEAGYEWDAEKKELKKIEQNIVISNFESKLCELFQKFRWYKDTPTNGDILEYVKTHSPELLDIAINEQKPAWSEEDEELIKLSISNLTELKDRFGEEYGKVGDCIDWVKSLKDRVQLQPGK